MTGINLSDNDIYATMLKVAQKGGAIVYDRVPAGATNATATGTSAARVSISTTYPVMSGVSELIAIAPGITPTAAAVATNILGFVDVQGSSYKRQPQQVPAPVGSVYLSVGSQRVSPQEWWKTCAPVVAADAYDWGFTSSVANAGNMKAWVDVMYATIPSGDPTIFSQVSAVTAFKGAGANSTASLTLTAANGLYEIGTVVAPEAAAVAGETQVLSTSVSSGALLPIQTINYGQEAPAVIGTTSGDTQVNQISRYMMLGSRFKIPNPTLAFSTNILTATSNNLNTVNFARYTSF